MSPPPSSRLESGLAFQAEWLNGRPIAILLPATADLEVVETAPTMKTGWCTLPDEVSYVAVRTPMPAVTGAMVDWWFDWHPRDPLRYRVWHPLAHVSNRLEPPPAPREEVDADEREGEQHRDQDELDRPAAHDAVTDPDEAGCTLGEVEALVETKKDGKVVASEHVAAKAKLTERAMERLEVVEKPHDDADLLGGDALVVERAHQHPQIGRAHV